MLGRDRDNYSPQEDSFTPTKSGGGTVLSRDAEFKGSLTFKSNLRIDGTFEGDITSAGTMHVGEEGVLKAEVNAGNAIVEGKVTGNITTKDKLELRSTAKLFGDIKAARLVINEGVVFVGKCEVNPSDSKIEVFRPDEKKASESNEENQESEFAANK